MNRLSSLWLAIASVFSLFAVGAGAQGIVWEEDFTGQTGKGVAAGPVTNMTGITKWSVTVDDALPTNGYFMVATNSTLKEFFEGNRLVGECAWQSEVIDISAAGRVDLSLQLQETGTMATNDTIGIYYRLNGTSEVQFLENGYFSGDYGSDWITALQPHLLGSSVQIIVRMKTSNNAAKKHRIDNVRVAETSIMPDQPPALAVENGETNRFATVGNTVQFTLTATENPQDALADTITLRADGPLPAGATFVETNGLSPLSQVFSWTPAAPGIETVAFYASDKDGTNRLDVTITVSQLDPGKIWINEIHYDNTGTDTNEGVEVAGPAGHNLADYKVYFHNGNGGAYYSVTNLSGTIDNEGDGFGAVWFNQVGIQNGDPDGMALVRETGGETNVLQFLSYEGVFVATDGPAAGLSSVDMGADEHPDNTSPIDESLQLTGKGKVYTDFRWTGPVAHSRGSLNAGQQIVRPGFVFIVR